MSLSARYGALMGGRLERHFIPAVVAFAPLLQSIEAERRREIDTSVLREIARYYDGQSVKFTATVNITVAAK